MKRNHRKKRKPERKMTRGYRELSEAIQTSLEYSHLLTRIISGVGNAGLRGAPPHKRSG